MVSPSGPNSASAMQARATSEPPDHDLDIDSSLGVLNKTQRSPVLCTRVALVWKVKHRTSASRGWQPSNQEGSPLGGETANSCMSEGTLQGTQSFPRGSGQQIARDRASPSSSTSPWASHILPFVFSILASLPTATTLFPHLIRLLPLPLNFRPRLTAHIEER